MGSMSNIFLLGFLAMVISILITPLIKKLAFKFSVVSVPKDDRRIHIKTMPLMGGLAIYISFIICLILKKGLVSQEQMGILIGASIIAFYGVLDDKFQLRPLHKLGFQILAACVLMKYGIKINYLTNPFSIGGAYIPMYWISYPLTLLWVVGVTNAVNLIDGLDGLAAGISCISALTIFIIAIINGRYEAAFLAIILSGAIIGFLPYNFNPASIFMGEVGSALLGFLLAAISMEGAIKSAVAFAIVVPILALGVPIYDTLFAIVRRKVNGKPISMADKGHLHHRLLDMGLSQRQSVIVMYLISAFLGGVAIIAMQISIPNSYLLLGLVILTFLLIAWKYDFFKHKG
jgi:UDP-GlcNAc:undecaprenyl-phosphate/decaprenyl-phosphate GlcNAc-1-phosphate transferase